MRGIHSNKFESGLKIQYPLKFNYEKKFEHGMKLEDTFYFDFEYVKDENPLFDNLKRNLYDNDYLKNTFVFYFCNNCNWNKYFCFKFSFYHW